MSKDLTIILVTFNSSKILHQSLLQINFEKYDCIVVDNASLDGSAEIVESNFLSIKLIKNSKNIGFSRANNIALAQLKTKFALLLNVDALIFEEEIDKIINLLKQNPQIVISCPIVYSATSFEGKNTQGIPFLHINKKHHYSEDSNFYYNQFITGAAMFLNMDMMQKVGFFDEGFFLYCEDNEICKRVIKKGYKTAIIKDTKFFHLSGKSSNDSQSAKVLWHKFGWSKLYYTQRIWGRPVAMLKAIRMILKFSILLIKDLLAGRQINIMNKAAIKGCFAYLIGLGAFDANGNPRG